MRRRGVPVSVVQRSLVVMSLAVGLPLGCAQSGDDPAGPSAAAESLDVSRGGLDDSPAAAGPGAVADPSSLGDDGCAGGTPSAVTVDARAGLARFSPLAVGLIGAAWDGSLVDAGIPKLLRSAGIQTLRYPGGSTSDNYHWSSNAPDDPAQGGPAPAANFAAYMAVVTAAGAQSMITVNYGSGTAQEAANWVSYATRGGPRYRGVVPTYPGASAKGHSYGIRYWELGNELYGDGTYGAQWEVDHAPNDPPTYAGYVVCNSAAKKK